jgi:hypothetical protein
METKTAPGDLGIASRLSRSRGRTGRYQNANARLTAEELAELKAAAKASGKAFGEWNREVLLREARRGAEDRALFTELIALRVFMNKILKKLAVGKTMTDEEFEKALSETKHGKHHAASDVLTQYSNREGGK